MPTQVELTNENGILTATITGTYSPDSAKERFTQILKAAEKYNTNKVLVDTTGISNITSSLLNAYDYGKFTASEFEGHVKKGLSSIRFAYLYLPQYEEVLKFGETVAQNRGLIAKAFTDIDEAIIWLKDNP